MKIDTRLILAMDVTDRDAALDITEKTAPYLDAVKVGYPLVLAAGIDIISDLARFAPVIADFKVADIPNTDRLILQQSYRAGAAAVIVHAFTGHDSLDECVAEAAKWNRDVFAVTEMSHPGASDFLASAAEDMARMAARSGVTGVVAPATRPQRIAVIREIVGDLTIISPGVGVQGGSAADTIIAGADYVIVGRSIYQSDDPALVTKKITDEILTVL
ncbi:MAG TPA: orotidine-5'-phosphate decarboxylase [Candidatus Nanoarchaeia archaeon]|nr:orotidine-5'-phosphate decarboxylase [Candidatus Nanoarchaeia archaeon]